MQSRSPPVLSPPQNGFQRPHISQKASTHYHLLLSNKWPTTLLAWLPLKKALRV